jgi:hypothetical protein
MASNHEEKAQALRTLLEWEYAEHYRGTDDDLSDRTEAWISGLEAAEVADIYLEIFQKGI